MAKVIPLPNGSYFPIDEGQSVASALEEARHYYPEAFETKQAQPEAQPEGGFFPALKSAYSAVKSEGAGLLGRSGLMDLADAEKYIEEQKKYQADTFKGTTKSWAEDPLTHVKELVGGSLPYMVAPALAGAAVAGGVALAPEAAAAAGLAELLPSAGLGAAARYGLTSAGSRLATGLAGATSAAQFTGSNIARQVEDGGKTLGETDIVDAALAAIPQAALDTISLRMIPGLGKIFERAGINLGEKEVKNYAEEAIKKTVADYALKTGRTMGIEGLTEAGQQVFERAQAGLSITDPEARQEYFDSFIGGAVLGGVIAPAGRYVERGQAQTRYDIGEAVKQQTAQQEQLKLDALAAAEEEQKKSSPEYFQTLSAEYKAAEQAKNELKGQLRKVVTGSETETADRLHNQEITAQLKEMSPGVTALAAEYNRLLKVQPKAEEVAPPVKPNLAVGDMLDNPLGNFTKEELASRAPTVAKYIDTQRKKAGKPALDTYSIEDIRNAMPNQLPEAEQADLSSLIAAKSGHTGEILYKPTDVIEVAKQKNIDTTTEGFKDFLRRSTGDAELEQLTQPQLHSAFTALSSLPRFDEPQILPTKRNATDYSKEQYDKAVAGLQKLVEDRKLGGTEVVKEGEKPIAKPVSIEEANQVIKAQTGLKNDADVQTLFREANRNGDIDLNSKNEVTYQQKGAQAEFNIEEGTAPAEGTGFNVMRDGQMLFATNDEAEATAKAEKLGKDAAPAIQQIDKSINKENATVADSQKALDAMEAEGKFNTPQYTQAAARHAGVVDKANKTIQSLNAKKQMLQKPVTVQKAGKPTNRKTFTVKEKGVEEKAFNTRQEAEQHALENLPEERLNELSTQTKAPGFANRLKKEQERRKKPVLALPAPAPKGPSAEATALHAKLLPMLRKFGLGDVALKIEEAMQNEGEYSASVIKVALDATNPLGVLRHEVIHGLKDLGFFTPGQWKILENKADKEWTDKYLRQRNVDGGPLKAGEQSRYDAYDKEYNGDVDAIREEAISDAFRDFDVNGAPKGLFAQLLDAMRKFFRNLRSALNGAGYETAEDIFGKVERGELKATKAAESGEAKPSLSSKKEEKVDPNDVSRVVTDGPYADAAVRTMNSQITQTSKPLEVDDVGRLFDKAFFDEFKRKGDWKNEADFKRAVNQAISELKYQLQQTKSGLDWYEQDIAEAFEQTQKYIPSLKKPEKRALFSVIAGIMSPSVNARDNWVIAALAYQHYEKTGILPGNNPATGGLWQGGLESANKKKQLDMLNAMLQPISKGGLGEKGAVEWLQGDHTVAEITDFRQKYGGMGKSSTGGKATDILPGFTAFGPKVGPFVMNINGIHDVTVDVWMTRTFNRYFGQMMGPDDKMLRAPTEPQRVAIKKLATDAAAQVGIKPYQVQSTLWFFEQQLFNKLGTGAKSYGFSDGAIKFAESQGGTGAAKGTTANVSANAPANKSTRKQAVGTGAQTNQPAIGQQGVKPSLRSGVIAEVAPNPDQEVAKKWRNMSPADKLRTTTAVANKAVGRVFDELGLKGYTFEVSSGRYEGETNPNVLVYAPKGASIEELSELSKVLGYVLDQKAMVSFDEGDVTSGSQAGFVKVAVPDGMTDADLARLREHISEKVPQADSDTLREKSLLYGNFSAYNDSVDTLTDEQYHRAIRDAVLDFEYDGIVDVSDIHKFHSEFTWPDNREAYLEGTRYGTSEGYRSTEGADVRRSGRGNLDNISQEAISLRDRWIESTARPEQPANRPSTGGGGGIALGNQQERAKSFLGIHYGKNATPLLLGRMSGTGIKGAEQTRLANSTDSRIKQRVYFYIPKTDGSMPKPESGVGNYVHTQRLNNMLSSGEEMSRLYKEAGGDFNKFESGVIDAGYDGYAIPDMGMMVVLNHDVPTTYQGTVADLRSSGKLQDNQIKASLRTAPNTPEFKQWFGDSKIVDADGNPRVMYHGTARDITAFKPKQAGAIFLTDSPQFAGIFSKDSAVWMAAHADQFLTPTQLKEGRARAIVAIRKDYKSMSEGKEMIDSLKDGDYNKATPEAQEYLRNAYKDMMPSGPNIMPVYVRAEKPFDYENPEHVKDVLDEMNKSSDSYGLPSGRNFGGIKTGNWEQIESKRVQNAIKKLGYDGFYVFEGSEKNLAVYDPSQIKSATGNEGTYDINNPDIRKSLRTAPNTPEFKRWFKKSKVVDENGNPVVVYHTGRFDADEIISGAELNRRTGKNMFAGVNLGNEGIYFTANPKYSAAYGKDKEGATMYPVYLSLQNPFVIKDKQQMNKLEKLKHFVFGKREILKNPSSDSDPRLDSMYITPEYKAELTKAGYDGIINEVHNEIVAFESTQIKSAIGNEGTYDPTNPDIRKSLRSAAGMFDQDELKKHAETRYKSREKVVEMDIDDFLNLAEYTNSVTDSNSSRKMKDARERVANGTKFTTLPYLSIDGYSGTLKTTGHEGRHRAKALQEVGYKTMPVLLHSDIRWSEQNDPEKFDYQEDWPTRIEAQDEALYPNFSIPFPFTREEAGMDYEQPTQARASLRTNVKNDISSMPNGAAILATMNRVTPPRETKGFVERITNALAPEAWSYFRQQAIDRYNRLNDYDKLIAKQMGGVELLADQSAHWAALHSDNAAGITASALGIGDRMGGVPVLKNGYFTVSNLNGTVKGLVEIISPLARHGDPDIYRSYQLWSAAKRGTRLYREGRFDVLSPTEIKDALTLSQKYPEFVTVQQEWTKYNNGLVKLQVDAGVITKEAGAEFMKYSDYIPLYRQMDGESTLGPSIYQSISGVKAPKTLKGKGTGPIEDYLETIVRNTQAAVQASMKNVAAKKAVENGMMLGMVKKLPATSSAPNTITILENGQKVSYECADKLFIEAVSSLNLPELPFLSILAKPADLLRALVTKDPGFMLANMMRDSVSAYVTSGANINPVVSTVKNFGDAMMNRSPTYQALLNAGALGGYEFSRNVEAGADALASDLRKKTGTQSGAEKLFKPFTGVWNFLERGTEASDAATRMAVYEATMKETGNEAEAIRRAVEVMNFNRKGRSAVVRIAAAAIPFLNARIQGLDVFFRAGIRPFYDPNSTAYEKQVQKAMLIRGATIMALSTMYAAAVMGDPDYEKQEQETKDNFWLIPSLGIKLPIPFEVGTLFKTIPERIYRYYYGADTSKDLGDSMKRALLSTFAFNPVPQAVAPLLEARDNYSVFTQRPIVGEAMRNIAPEFQVGPSTTKMAEFLGKQTGMSPILIDHVYKGYTGTMGMYLADVMDSVYSAGSDNPKASQRFEQTPVLKRFLLDPDAKGQVSAYYDLKHSVDQTVRTVNLLAKQGSPELEGYISENVSMLGAKKYVASVDRQMQKLSAQAAMIRSTPMPADEKRKMLDEITQIQNQLTNEVQLMRKMARP